MTSTLTQFREILRGVIMLFFVSFLGSVSASEYSAGREAAITGNYEEAIAIFEQLVPQGNVLAIYSLGQMYQNGVGVLKDYEKARSYYHLASLLEYPEAQFSLGAQYISLAGVSFSDEARSGSAFRRDVIRGYAWLNIAAKNGHIEASNTLNRIEDLGLPPDLIIEAQRLAKDCEHNLYIC